MALTKYKLGDLIEPCDAKNQDLKYGIDDVKGISIQKIFIETKADMTDVSLSPYLLVQPDDFVYVTVTSRNGEKITLAHNTSEDTFIVSSSYVVFRVKDAKVLNSDYLFMYFNRPEFDRYSRFNSWGSARETFSWEDMCDIDIDLPSIDIQKKYVAIYNSLLANQKSYERGLDDLKLVCDAYIEDLRRKYPCKRIGDYIKLSDTQNKNLKYGLENLKGISIQKKFIETKADMKDVPLHSYLVVQPDDFAYVTVTSRNGEKITLAHNSSNDTYIVSSSYVVFRISEPNLLDSKYLFLFLSRSEFDRYSRFHSWGSARETFDWQDMQEVCIPIPDIKLQNSIADIFEVYSHRISVNERLKQQIKDICPILIKGSIEEAQKKN